MKKFTLVLSVFIFLVVACKPDDRQNINVPANSPGMNTNAPMATPSPAATAPAQIVDVPKLVGKSPAEVEKMLGKPEATDKLNATDTTGELSYDYSTPDAHFFINFKNKKANYFHFTFERSFPTTFEIGDRLGLNLRGIEPETANAGLVGYKGTIAGTDWKEISLIGDSGTNYKTAVFRKQ